ncbi:MAG UNVERIFIED_CONTAM: hypothetical protein LVR29_08065 [Microcystis novacekii LVE1205-3]
MSSCPLSVAWVRGTVSSDSPSGIAVGSGGNIYVADTNNNRVQVFDSSGGFQSAFGSAGSVERSVQSALRYRCR